MKKQRLSKKFSLENKDKVDISLDNLIELIKTPHLKQTKNDLKIIQNYLCQKVDYFKKLTQDPDGNEKIPKIISVLNYESFRKDEHIIYFGEIGDKFYIILSGTVSIYKPSPKNMNMTLHEYVDYLVRVRDREKNLLKFERIQNYNSNIDKVKLLIINYNSSKLPYSAKKIPVIIEEERFILKLGPGDSFGEMALIKNEPRNANIIANESCELVSIDKVDYRKIIKDLEEQRINNQLRIFKMDYPFFKDWPANRCFRLLSSFDTDNYGKDEYVYKQNNLANYIYLIKKGEFEVTSDINFSTYEQFIDYIYDSSETLLNDMDNPLLWKEDNIQQKINNANENNTCPCILTLPPIYKVILSHRIDCNIDNDDNSNIVDNKIKNNSENNNINEENKEEKNNYINSINHNKTIRRIKIKKLEAPQIFGFIEPFELKRRICNIKCNSREGIIQKLPFMEFLQLLPKDKKNRFFLEQNIYTRKKEIIEQLKNGALVKLSFNFRKPCKKFVKIYPGRNMDKIPKKKPKILIKSISLIKLNKNDKSNNIKDINKNDKDNNNTTSIINKEFPIRIKKNIMLGFKKSLFSFSKKKVKSIENIMPIELLSQKGKTTFTSKKNNNRISSNNSYCSMKYLEDNNFSTILPTKTSLMPIYDSTGKNYVNSSTGNIMNKVYFRNNISEFSHISNGNKYSEVSLPNIENKKIENYSYKNIPQNNGIIKGRKKISRSLLNNKQYNSLFM